VSQALASGGSAMAKALPCRVASRSQQTRSHRSQDTPRWSRRACLPLDSTRPRLARWRAHTPQGLHSCTSTGNHRPSHAPPTRLPMERGCGACPLKHEPSNPSKTCNVMRLKLPDPPPPPKWSHSTSSNTSKIKCPHEHSTTSHIIHKESAHMNIHTSTSRTSNKHVDKVWIRVSRQGD
jgi:hypothetical protein